MDKQAMLDELIRLNTLPDLQPDEFTTAQYMERQKELGLAVPYNTVNGQLQGMVRKGILTMRPVIHDGKKRNAYRFMQEPGGESGPPPQFPRKNK
jgi:hypothetical protein